MLFGFCYDSSPALNLVAAMARTGADSRSHCRPVRVQMHHQLKHWMLGMRLRTSMHFCLLFINSNIHVDWDRSANYHIADLEMMFPHPQTMPTNSLVRVESNCN